MSILNTVMFAGSSGYVVKLWMVDPGSAEIIDESDLSTFILGTNG